MSAALTHPCEYRECESCNELTEIDAQLKELYERQHEARVKRNYFHSSFIRRFPLEIVTSIFLFAFPPQESCPVCSFHSDHASPLVLTKVCHTWRELALSTPRLWSFISFDAGKPNFPLLNHQITHSGVVPLSVYLYAGEQELATAMQAMSLVIKQLHRIALLYFHVGASVAIACGFMSDSDYPKTAPLLREFHFHPADVGPDYFPLTLAIEPPRPQQVYLEGIESFSQIHLDWTSVSSLILVNCDIQTLPPALDSLKHLTLLDTSWDMDQTPVVSQSIQHVTHAWSDPTYFMLTMTLRSLRMLDVQIMDVRTLTPITCDFLHRSLCPLQVLSIHYRGSYNDGGRVIQALIDVLEITNVLQRLTLRLLPRSSGKPLSSSFKPLTSFIPPVNLLLDAMAPNPPSEIPNGPNLNTERPLHTLDLGLDIPRRGIRPIHRDVLVRILQMRAAGKMISITCTQRRRLPDLVKQWKSFYGFGED